MNPNHPSTAIVLFARRAEDEAIHKTLLPTQQRNLELHSKLIDSSRAIASHFPDSFLHFHEDLQQGDSFGERLANCVRQVFAQGFSKIILIGGDCPNLTSLDIQKARLSVEVQDFAVGPDQNGGAYLIGFSSDQFDYQSFRDLNWNSDQLYEELKSYADAFARVEELPVKIDLNSSDDVLSHATTSPQLKKILSGIFLELFKKAPISVRARSFNPAHRNNRRGPPVYV